MTVTFGSVELKEASKLSNTIGVLANERVLISGRRRIKSNSEFGFGAVYSFIGTWDDVTAILALIGTSQTLTDNEETNTVCYIYGDIKIEESDSPGIYTCEVGFKQDTS